MDTYKVIKDFTDLEDNNYIYRAGKPFPRDGMNVSVERIEQLASNRNKRKEPLIKVVAVKKSIDKLEALTNEELKERLNKRGIEYKANDNKGMLIKRLLEAGEEFETRRD